MKKIFTSAIITFIISLIFYLPSAFANNMVNDATNGVRNVVGGAENAVEGAAKSGTGAIKNGINTVGNGAKNTTNTMKTDAKNATANDGYTATRTATGANNNLFGMNNLWSWIVVGAIALIIIGLIWYYMARQNNYNNHNDQ